ncbi:hypothetical protein [Mesorhizobium sp.]|uniref:hypothetical protein n=1 Tax=Mesorhizobium sp. TaxID=1871066 RepID=UPI000FE41DB8|nr:hypothetical protein [Mesorhizobium sp.]RWN98593.1 MAG: hypothetical protein EOS06_22310 [Mesorhizobium sp.]
MGQRYKYHCANVAWGRIWAARGWPDVYSKQTVTLDPHREHIVFSPFTAPDRMSVLDVAPERIAIATRDGRIIEERFNPRGSFPLPFLDGSTPWDAIQVAYFTSAAVWNYLTAPFVFTLPGVEAREIAPWRERARKRGDGWPSRSLRPLPTITPIRSFITMIRLCSGAWTIRPT